MSTPRTDRSRRRSDTERAGEATAIRVRHPRFDLDDLPRYWLAGSPAVTHFGNAGHVFIPLGEDFFVDSVKLFRDRVEDPGRRRDLNAFVGQETVHARAHEAVWAVLADQGVPVETYCRFIARVRALEPYVPASFRLSVTAALEHYTAAFGHSFITEDLADVVPDEMARLLAWHGLEELEHRAVAFDLLTDVDDRYAMRVAGFAFATGLLVVVPVTGLVMFAIADRRRIASRGPEPTPPVPGPHLRSMTARFVRRVAGHLVAYLRPGFHPRDIEVPTDAARRWDPEPV